MLLNLMEEPEKIPVAGKVVWITKGAQGNRAAGIGVQFNDGDNTARNKIETHLAGALKSDRPTPDVTLTGSCWSIPLPPRSPRPGRPWRLARCGAGCRASAWRRSIPLHRRQRRQCPGGEGPGRALCRRALFGRRAPAGPGAESAPALDWLLGELAHPRVVAIGETGLDYHYEPEAAELQQEAFRLHLEAARITAKPVIVHTREARAPIRWRCCARRRCRRPACCIASPRTGRWRDRRWTASTFPRPASSPSAMPMPARGGSPGTGRPAAGGDRLALPGADSPSRQAEPAGIRARCRRIRDVAWRQPGNPGGADYRQFPSAVSVGPLGRQTDKTRVLGMNPGQDHWSGTKVRIPRYLHWLGTWGDTARQYLSVLVMFVGRPDRAGGF